MKKRSQKKKLNLKQETLSQLNGGIPELGPEIEPASQNSRPIWHCLCLNVDYPGPHRPIL